MVKNFGNDKMMGTRWKDNERQDEEDGKQNEEGDKRQETRWREMTGDKTMRGNMMVDQIKENER